MEYGLKYVAKEYKHGWSLWLERDDKKYQLGTAIKSEKDVEKLIESITLEKETLTDKDKLDIALKKIEQLEKDQELFKSVLEHHGYLFVGKIRSLKGDENIDREN